MGTVTQYNLANVRDALGGGNPVSMSQYYRGGARVPTSRTVATNERDPASGEYYNRGFAGYRLWRVQFSGYGPGYAAGGTNNYITLYWGGNMSVLFGTTAIISSYTHGDGWTYIRGSYREFDYDSTYNTTVNYFGIYRQRSGSSTISINTGVPSSGSIALSQLFGAENP